MVDTANVVPPDGGLPSATVLEELKRVRVIFDTARAVAQTLEAQLMESLWKIRKEIGGDQARFELLIRSNTKLDPQRAWLMAETWDKARRNRDLRQLASQQPSQALQLVSQFVEGGLAEKLESLSDHDHEVAGLFSLPPRKRNAKVRQMIAEAQAARKGHNPADLAEIETLQAERDAALEEMEKAKKVTPHPGSEMRQALDDLRDAEKRLAQVCENMRSLLQGASDRVRDEAQRLGRTAMTTIENLLSDVYESQQQAKKDQAD